MITPEQAHRGIDLGFHVLILFTFLSIFFFSFIARKERDAVTSELNNSIDNTIPIILDNVDKMNKKTGININWEAVNDFAQKIEQKYGNNPDPDIDKHNKKLVITAVFIGGVLLFIIICSILYFKLYKKYDISLGKILLDNFLVFIFIGIIEGLFFMNVALKYSPVTESDMITNIINRTEYQINQQLYPK